jgi:hypothetical protein
LSRSKGETLKPRRRRRRDGAPTLSTLHFPRSHAHGRMLHACRPAATTSSKKGQTKQAAPVCGATRLAQPLTLFVRGGGRQGTPSDIIRRGTTTTCHQKIGIGVGERHHMGSRQAAHPAASRGPQITCIPHSDGGAPKNADRSGCEYHEHKAARRAALVKRAAARLARRLPAPAAVGIEMPSYLRLSVPHCQPARHPSTHTCALPRVILRDKDLGMSLAEVWLNRKRDTPPRPNQPPACLPRLHVRAKLNATPSPHACGWCGQSLCRHRSSMHNPRSVSLQSRCANMIKPPQNVVAVPWCSKHLGLVS